MMISVVSRLWRIYIHLLCVSQGRGTHLVIISRLICRSIDCIETSMWTTVHLVHVVRIWSIHTALVIRWIGYSLGISIIWIGGSEVLVRKGRRLEVTGTIICVWFAQCACRCQGWRCHARCHCRRGIKVIVLCGISWLRLRGLIVTIVCGLCKGGRCMMKGIGRFWSIIVIIVACTVWGLRIRRWLLLIHPCRLFFLRVKIVIVTKYRNGGYGRCKSNIIVLFWLFTLFRFFAAHTILVFLSFSKSSWALLFYNLINSKVDGLDKGNKQH